MTPSTILLGALLGLAGPHDGFRDLTYDQARTLAQEEGRLVLVAFYAEDCPPCAAMDAEMFAAADVQAWLEKHTVAIRTTSEARLAARYAIGPRPTILLLSEDGEELERIDTLLSPAEFLGDMDLALAHHASAELLAQARTRVDRGRALVAEDKPAQALEQFLWAFDHTRDLATWSKARLGGLLGEVVALFPRVPEARKALEARRDAAEKRVLASEQTTEAKLVQSAHEAAALNHWLGAAPRSHDLWRKVRAREDRSPQVAAALFDITLQEYLLQQKRFDEFLLGLEPDPVDTVYRRLGALEQLAQQAAEDRRLRARYQEDRNVMVNLVARCYRAFLGLGDEQRAADVAELLLVLLPQAQSYQALIRAAELSGRPELGADFLNRGLAILQDQELRSLRKMNQPSSHRH